MRVSASLTTVACGRRCLYLFNKMLAEVKINFPESKINLVIQNMKKIYSWWRKSSNILEDQPTLALDSIIYLWGHIQQIKLYNLLQPHNAYLSLVFFVVLKNNQCLMIMIKLAFTQNINFYLYSQIIKLLTSKSYIILQLY